MTGLAVQTFLTMLVILDPIGLAPLFAALAGRRTEGERRVIAGRAVTVAGAILFSFAVAGAWVMHRLGISLGAFRVAGGLLLFRIALDMVFAQHERETPEEAQESMSRRDITVFPLAIPLIAGPGALASVMILAGQAGGLGPGLAVVLGMTAVVLILCYLSLRLSSRVASLLGQTGVNVVTRVMGVILTALAVQYVADGANSLLGLFRAGAPGGH
jgi:multiple antibiotic resistance protein